MIRTQQIIHTQQQGVINIMRKKRFPILLSALLVLSLAACAEKDSAANSSTTQPVDESGSVETEASAADRLTVRFGDSGAPFTMYLEDNDTAAAIARHVGGADWRLPIYHYDDLDGWESFRYYDIPSRYEVPSNAETVTSEKAGEVYCSEPNRIVPFCHDAEISGEYALVGRIDVTDEFTSAVENNPVLEGWGNKIVQISAGE